MSSLVIKTKGMKVAKNGDAADASADASAGATFDLEAITDFVNGVPEMIITHATDNKFEVIASSVCIAMSTVALTLSVINYMQLNPGKM